MPQRIERATRLLLVTAILLMPWTAVAQQPSASPSVPVGGGFGRLVRFHERPVNVQAQGFYNVVKPDDDPTADWTLRLQVQLLFPK